MIGPCTAPSGHISGRRVGSRHQRRLRFRRTGRFGVFRCTVTRQPCRVGSGRQDYRQRTTSSAKAFAAPSAPVFCVKFRADPARHGGLSGRERPLELAGVGKHVPSQYAVQGEPHGRGRWSFGFFDHLLPATRDLSRGILEAEACRAFRFHEWNAAHDTRWVGHPLSHRGREPGFLSNLCHSGPDWLIPSQIAATALIFPKSLLFGVCRPVQPSSR